MIAAGELAIMVRQTASFVAADPESIAVTAATTRVADGAGGHTETPGAPFTTTVRLIPQADKVPTVDTWEGTREKVEYVLIAVPAEGARLTKGSIFGWRGQSWRISQVHDKPDYAFKADVVLDAG